MKNLKQGFGAGGEAGRYATTTPLEGKAPGSLFFLSRALAGPRDFSGLFSARPNLYHLPSLA